MFRQEHSRDMFLPEHFVSAIVYVPLNTYNASKWNHLLELAGGRARVCRAEHWCAGIAAWGALNLAVLRQIRCYRRKFPPVENHDGWGSLSCRGAKVEHSL